MKGHTSLGFIPQLAVQEWLSCPLASAAPPLPYPAQIWDAGSPPSAPAWGDRHYGLVYINGEEGYFGSIETNRGLNPDPKIPTLLPWPIGHVNPIKGAMWLKYWLLRLRGQWHLAGYQDLRLWVASPAMPVIFQPRIARKLTKHTQSR